MTGWATRQSGHPGLQLHRRNLITADDQGRREQVYTVALYPAGDTGLTKHLLPSLLPPGVSQSTLRQPLSSTFSCIIEKSENVYNYKKKIWGNCNPIQHNHCHSSIVPVATLKCIFHHGDHCLNRIWCSSTILCSVFCTVSLTGPLWGQHDQRAHKGEAAPIGVWPPGG